MAGGGGTTLEQTPTWAVAVVCFVLVAISIAIEHLIHLVGKLLKKRNKSALYEALEKIKAELMLLGFLSLLLTVGQGPISGICVSKAIAATWHPCSKKQEAKYQKQGQAQRKLLAVAREVTDHHHGRILAGADYDKCAARGKVAFVSTYGIHQLHIFIFVLAISHIIYCIITYALGRAKMSKWKKWEKETRTTEYQYTHDPERFRFTRDTSFGRRHLNFWSHSSILLWIACFFRQFVTSVPKVDYLTLRHGFIMAHLAPQGQTNFDFQKYIKRSLEDDFKVVVGISPLIWFFALVFLLFNTHGSFSYLYLPFIPILIILVVGAKLQVIITQMGLAIQEKGLVTKGTPVVQPGDELFWFSRPRLLLYLIHFVLFQNAFQLAFFAWTWYEFGLRSCYHEKSEDIIIRLVTGVVTQILCSYVTLPLYALVTQMGTTMKPTIFNDKIVKALHSWHQSAKKHVKQSHHNAASRTPSPSRPSTPMSGMSPVHLLRHYRSSDVDSPLASPRVSNFGNEVPRAVSPTHHHVRSFNVHVKQERQGREMGPTHLDARDSRSSPSHEIDIN